VIIGDNCSTNKRIADIMEHPLIGCFSHKFNLAIKKWIKEQMGLCNAIDAVADVIKHASTMKNAAALRALTDECYSLVINIFYVETIFSN